MSALGGLPESLCGQNAATRRLSALVRTVLLALLTGLQEAAQQRLTSRNAPRRTGGRLVEPPKGIEPLTYSLRVNRSGRLS